jgi:hypothetical protein
MLKQLRSPPEATLRARTAMHANAATALKQRVEAYGGAYIHFRMCELVNRNNPPLSWDMSDTANFVLKEVMINNCGNDREWERLQECLSDFPQRQSRCGRLPAGHN